MNPSIITDRIKIAQKIVLNGKLFRGRVSMIFLCVKKNIELSSRKEQYIHYISRRIGTSHVKHSSWKKHCVKELRSWE